MSCCLTVCIGVGPSRTADLNLAKSAAASLVSHLNDISPQGFMALLNAKCAALGLNFVVTNMSVSQQPTFTDPSAGSGSDTVVIVLVIVIIALVIGTGAYLLCRKKHDPTDNLKLFKQPDGNETLQQKNKVPGMGDPLDDKTVQI